MSLLGMSELLDFTIGVRGWVTNRDETGMGRFLTYSHKGAAEHRQVF